MGDRSMRATMAPHEPTVFHETGRPMSALTMLRAKRQRDATSPPLHLLPSRPLLRQQQQQQNEQRSSLPLLLGISELAGCAGVGKTQLALGLCVTCALQHGNTALYLSLGEGSPQVKIAQRLQTILTDRHQNNTPSSSKSSSTTTKQLLDRIWTRSMRNQDELLHFLQHELPTILRQTSVGVIVLDSLASMFRVSDHTNTNDNDNKDHYARRSQLLFGLAATLRRLSHRHHIPILVVNQASTSFQNKDCGTGTTFASTSRTLPALGLSWANCVNHSYWVTRRERGTTESSRGTNTTFQRHVTLQRSSHQPPTKLEFHIDAGGAFLLS